MDKKRLAHYVINYLNNFMIMVLMWYSCPLRSVPKCFRGINISLWNGWHSVPLACLSEKHLQSMSHATNWALLGRMTGQKTRDERSSGPNGVRELVFCWISPILPLHKISSRVLIDRERSAPTIFWYGNFFLFGCRWMSF